MPQSCLVPKQCRKGHRSSVVVDVSLKHGVKVIERGVFDRACRTWPPNAFASVAGPKFCSVHRSICVC